MGEVGDVVFYFRLLDLSRIHLYIHPYLSIILHTVCLAFNKSHSCESTRGKSKRTQLHYLLGVASFTQV